MSDRKQHTQLLYNKSTYSITVKYIIAIVTGIITLVLSEFNLSISFADLQVSFPWVLIFPLIITIAFGEFYGLVAGFSGAALYPLFLWPQGGFANFILIAFLLFLFFITGKVIALTRRKNESPLLRKLILLFIIVILACSVLYILLYPSFLSFNKYWYKQSLTELPYHILVMFTIKDSINFIYLLLLSELFLKLPFIRKLLGIASGYEMRDNHKIVGIAILTIGSTFLIFLLLDFLLIKNQGMEKGYRILVAIIILLTGTISFRILIRMFERRLIAEQQLLKSEAKFKVITEQANDIIILHWLNGVIEYISPSGEKILGVDRKNMIGKSISNLFHPDDLHIFSNNFTKLLETQAINNIIHRAKHKDGHCIWMETNGRLLEGSPNKKPLFLTMSRDISDRYKIQEAIKENELILSNIFDNAPFTMLLLDEQMRVIKINSHPFIHTSFKNTPQGKKIGEVFDCKIFQENLESEENTSNDYCIIKKLFTETLHKNKTFNKIEDKFLIKKENGNTENLTVLVSSTPLYKSSKKHVLITIDDITQRKKMEDQLKISRNKAEESDRLKSAFLANMSHEIRTPMNGILGFAQMLKNKNTLGCKETQFVDVILENSERLMILINDLLDISLIESGQLQFVYKETSLLQLFKELHQMFLPIAEKQGLELIFEQKTNDTIIITDDTRLRQVLNNLLHNAIKFTEKGSITFGYEEAINGWVKINVSDTGIGISENEQEKIFERFRQIDFEYEKLKGGTGLGLAISKKIIEHCGGEIHIESKKNQGSIFRIVLPKIPPNYNP